MYTYFQYLKSNSSLYLVAFNLLHYSLTYYVIPKARDLILHPKVIHDLSIPNDTQSTPAQNMPKRTEYEVTRISQALGLIQPPPPHPFLQYL